MKTSVYRFGGFFILLNFLSCGRPPMTAKMADTYPIGEDAKKVDLSKEKQELLKMPSPTPQATVNPYPTASPISTPYPTYSPTPIPSPVAPIVNQVQNMNTSIQNAQSASQSGNMNAMKSHLLQALCQMISMRRQLQSRGATAPSTSGFSSILSKFQNRTGSLFQKQQGASSYPKLQGASGSLVSSLTSICQNQSQVSTFAKASGTAGLSYSQWQQALGDLKSASQSITIKLQGE